MTVQLESIKVRSVKKQYEPHSTNETVGTVCHGCMMLDCIPKRSRLRRWGYYCNASGEHVDPRAMTADACPRGGRIESKVCADNSGPIVRDDGMRYESIKAAARHLIHEHRLKRATVTIAKRIGRVVNGDADEYRGHTWRRA